MRTVLLALAACDETPDAFDAWQGVLRIDALDRIQGACEGEPAPFEPFQPYLYTAVADYDVPALSLYWCTREDVCDDAPFSTTAIEEITRTRLVAALGEAATIGDALCVASWDGVVAEQQGDAVSVAFSTYRAEVQVESVEECQDYVASVLHAACDDVLLFEGTRTP